MPKKIRVAWAIAFFVLTPISLIAAIGSTGAGHGDYLFAFAFYPLPVVMIMGWDMLVPGIVVAIAQFPIWAIAGLMARTWKAFGITAGSLLIAHVAMATYVFIHG